MTRRQVLLGGAGGLGALFAATMVDGYVTSRSAVSTTAQAIGSVPVPTSADPLARDAVGRTEWVYSTARRRPVRLVTVAPAGSSPAGLPVCLALHGLHATASWWGEAGNRRLLGAAFSRGVRPFALVAVDGGDSYWHPARPDDDPLRMLLTEVPRWLRDRRLGGPDGTPDAVAGVSMGGAGALLYARERARAGDPARAVAAISPGLFTDWRIAATRPFPTEPDWVAADPLHFYRELAGTPTAVWCGDRDAFAEAARRYIALAHPEIGSIEPGRHDGVFVARVMPRMANFLGQHLRELGGPALPGSLAHPLG